ncbi:MAG: hypothetical protein QM762_18500 [Chryseolinea sp.]
MNSEYFRDKIEKLSDDKLKALQLRNRENSEIIAMAQREAERRGIDPEAIEVKENNPSVKKDTKKDESKYWMWELVLFFTEFDS